MTPARKRLLFWAPLVLVLVGALLWPFVSVVLQWPQRPPRSPAEM